MSKRKLSVAAAVVCAVIGAGVLFGSQQIMKVTNTTEFCVSCHSMEHAKAEWEGSSHFSNAKGVRAECSDCHIPQDGLHYVKAKFVALKDVWYTITNKLPDKEAYEKHRLEMAQKVWDEMKENDSATCKSCHTPDVMITAEQSKNAQKMHALAKESNQTCIDCHKGLVHFMPEMQTDTATNSALSGHNGQFSEKDSVLTVPTLTTMKVVKGGEGRLMPFAELTNWKANGDKITATVSGWQQVGAESLVYLDLGKRVNVAVLDDEAKAVLNVEKTVHDEVTSSEWKKVNFEVEVAKDQLTADQNALNQFGNQLNLTHCSGCHAPIGAEHYTANQWIGVVNSMKDRTALTDDEVRALTIYLQRNAKDMGKASH